MSRVISHETFLTLIFSAEICHRDCKSSGSTSIAKERMSEHIMAWTDWYISESEQDEELSDEVHVTHSVALNTAEHIFEVLDLSAFDYLSVDVHI